MKKFPRHENMENNKLPTSLRGQWIHMKVFLIADAVPVTGGRCMEPQQIVLFSTVAEWWRNVTLLMDSKQGAPWIADQRLIKTVRWSDERCNTRARTCVCAHTHTHTLSHNVRNVAETNSSSHSMCKGSRKTLFIVLSLPLEDMCRSKAAHPHTHIHTHTQNVTPFFFWYHQITRFPLKMHWYMWNRYITQYIV